MFNNHFYHWVTKTKAAPPTAPADASPAEGGANAVSPAPTGPVDPNAPHLQVGKALAKVGVVATKDIYGAGAEPHGSPWKAPVGQWDAVINQLKAWGYRMTQKDIWQRKPLQVDMGKDANSVYLYITDDNT